MTEDHRRRFREYSLKPFGPAGGCACVMDDAEGHLVDGKLEAFGKLPFELRGIHVAMHGP